MLPVTQRQPVLVAFVIGAAPIVTAFILAVIDTAGSEIPNWIVAALTGLGPTIGALSAVWARGQVTPLADPRLDDGTPLEPSGSIH